MGVMRLETPSLWSAYPLISAVNIGNRTFNVGTIPPGSSVVIKPILYIANSAKESVQNLDLQVTYGDSYGNRQTFESSIGIIVSPLPQILISLLLQCQIMLPTKFK